MKINNFSYIYYLTVNLLIMKTKLYLLSSLFLCALNFTAYGQVSQNSNTLTPAVGQPTVTNSYVGSANNFDVAFKRQGFAAGLLSTTRTSFGVNSNAVINSVSIGNSAGQYSQSLTGNNVYIGFNSGKGQSATTINQGTGNVLVGNNTGQFNTAGNSNSFFGNGAGNYNLSGSGNTLLGSGAGSNNNTGNNNTFIGSATGFQNGASSGNVCIGYSAGLSPAQSTQAINNQLFVDNSQTLTPLIWGDFAANQVKLNGKVGVGDVTTFPTLAGNVSVTGYKLFVTGGILTDEVRVNASSGGTWADYVFQKEYNLKSLAEVEQYITDNGHLPNVPSAKEVQENGIALGEMAKIQQEKIEELTLYIIELNKKLEQQGKMIQELQVKRN